MNPRLVLVLSGTIDVQEGNVAKGGRSKGNGHGNGSVPAVQEMTREQILELIDARARYLLGIPGEEFMRRYRAGKLENAPVEAPITVLADLVAEG